MDYFYDICGALIVFLELVIVGFHWMEKRYASVIFLWCFTADRNSMRAFYKHSLTFFRRADHVIFNNPGVLLIVQGNLEQGLQTIKKPRFIIKEADVVSYRSANKQWNALIPVSAAGLLRSRSLTGWKSLLWVLALLYRAFTGLSSSGLLDHQLNWQKTQQDQHWCDNYGRTVWTVYTV